MNKLFLVIVLTILSVFNVSGQEEKKPLAVYKIGKSGNESIAQEVSAFTMITLGKVNLITFSMYFNACTPCVREIDSLSARFRSMVTNGKLNYAVVASIEDSDIVRAVFLKSFVEHKKWQFPIFLDTERKLAEALHIENIFPRSMLCDSNGITRYVTEPGTGDKKKYDQMELRIKDLSDACYDIYDFSVEELEKMCTLFSNELRPYMKKRGFFQKEEGEYTIITKQGEVLAVNIGDLEKTLIGVTLLKLTDEGKFLAYQQKFLDSGYSLKDTDPEKEKVTYSKGAYLIKCTTHNKDGFPFEIEIGL